MPPSPVSFPPVADQLTILRRGVEKIVPEEELAARLEKSRATGTPLRVKYGIDPTGIDVHLGHTVPLRKIRQFQDLGHQAVIIIGNDTALVGDPSGRDQTRARLTAEAVERNAADYLTQVGKVVDLSKAEVVRNGDWFGAMKFTDVLELCAKVTVAFLSSNRKPIGLPTSCERPITTAFLPASDAVGRSESVVVSVRVRFESARSSIVITPSGVHGRGAGAPCKRRP
jgi:hypothetical protein